MSEMAAKWYDIAIDGIMPVQCDRVVKVFAPGISNPAPYLTHETQEHFDGVCNAIGSIGIIDAAPSAFPRRILGYPTEPSVLFGATLSRYRDPKEGPPLPYTIACHHHSYRIPTFRLRLDEKLPMEPKLNKHERRTLLRQGYTLITREYVVSPLTPAVVEFLAKKSSTFLRMLKCYKGCTVQSIIERSYTNAEA